MEQNKNYLVWVFAAIVLLFLFSSFGMGGYSMMGFGLILMILFWGILIWIIFALIKTFQPNKEEDPLILLKKRYASGKISKKQYKEMKKEL